MEWKKNVTPAVTRTYLFVNIYERGYELRLYHQK